MYVDSMDESMDVSDHMGDASAMNQSTGMAGGSHTRALVMTWIFAVLVWWGLRFLFKGQLS
jgi:hypothetical protein